RGVGDTWLSAAVAGVAGVGVCFAVAGGVGLAVRRRRNSPADAVHTPAAPDDAGHAHHDAGGEQRDGRP
ncbi:MAG: hypothetical protein ACRDO8_10060, partial [Nocardioidaceae bacterium]